MAALQYPPRRSAARGIPDFSESSRYRWTRCAGNTGGRTSPRNAGSGSRDTCKTKSVLDNYYTGEVFGYRIMPESDDDNELDSCWGFYGTECMKELEAECRHIIDGQNKAAA